MSKITMQKTALCVLSLVSTMKLNAEPTVRHHLKKAAKHVKEGAKGLAEEIRDVVEGTVEEIKESDFMFSIFGTSASAENPLGISADEQSVHLELKVKDYDEKKAEEQNDFKPRVLPDQFTWNIPLLTGKMKVQIGHNFVNIAGSTKKIKYDQNDQEKVLGKNVERYQFQQPLPHPIKLNDISITRDAKAETITISAPRANIEKIVQVQKK